MEYDDRVLAEALHSAFVSPNVPDSNMEDSNVVDALDAAGRRIAAAMRSLGLGGAGTNMGAVELLAMEVRNGSRVIADGLVAIADAIHKAKGED